MADEGHVHPTAVDGLYPFTVWVNGPNPRVNARAREVIDRALESAGFCRPPTPRHLHAVPDSLTASIGSEEER